jgi:hypothetical protein
MVGSFDQPARYLAILNKDHPSAVCKVGLNLRKGRAEGGTGNDFQSAVPMLVVQSRHRFDACVVFG